VGLTFDIQCMHVVSTPQIWKKPGGDWADPSAKRNEACC
jgi:hypothetical protein